MSKSTLRKRIALTATTALFAGALSFVAAPSASAAAGDTNLKFSSGVAGSGLYVATQNSTTGAVIVDSATLTASTGTTARSLGLYAHNGTTGTAQTATVLVGGGLSLYMETSTNVSFSASGGTFSGATVPNKSVTGTYSQDVKTVFIANAVASTPVAVKWAAPSTAGTYTVSVYDASATSQNTSDLGVGGILRGAITVSVVAASAGGTYSAPYSACNIRSHSQGHGTATGVDSTTAITNNQTAYIAFDLDDAYDQSLDSGAIVVTATGGALVSLASNGSTAAAGTTSTVVSSAAPTDKVVQVTQGTANAPVTSTVTITFNGTTVCTKTVTIRGEVNKLTIANVGVQNLSGSTVDASAGGWIAATLGDAARGGVFTVTASDSAGNTVLPDQSGFAADSATLTTTVQGITISTANVATSLSTTTSAYGSVSVGTWTCGSSAGSASVKLKYTNATSGTTVSSDAFTAACAGNPYTYTASFDKASYVQGELAVLTVQFLDSKGNKANNVGAIGAMGESTPMLTRISSQGATSSVAKSATGTKSFTFSVGLTTGITAGAYVSTVQFADLAAGTAQTPSYKVSTGSTDVSNAEILKSIVALIASINKQIQALQKLILKK